MSSRALLCVRTGDTWWNNRYELNKKDELKGRRKAQHQGKRHESRETHFSTVKYEILLKCDEI